MGPLIPVALAIAAWGCSTPFGLDERPIMADSGADGKDSGLKWPEASSDASSYVDLPSNDPQGPKDGGASDASLADLFATDAGDSIIADVPPGTDTLLEISATPKVCEPKTNLPDGCAIVGIAAGSNVSCLIKSGQVYCSGKILTSVDPKTTLFDSTSFVAVPSLSGAKSIAIGGAHICAIMPANDVKCLGQNIWGQLGNGTTQDAKEAVAVSGMAETAAIFLGEFHSLGLNASGQLVAWGYNNNGQLGLAAMPSVSNVPQAVVLPAKAIHAAAGTLHSAAVLENGGVYAWGNNKLFPLGVGGNPGKVLTPMPVQNAKPGFKVAAGADFTLLHDKDCAVSAVGAGGLGQLGLGSSLDVTTLISISPLSGISTVVADGQHACAVTQAGALFCWGENNFGQVGNGASGAAVLAPAPISGVQPVAHAALGTGHSLALTAGCQVFAWGGNASGQLGTGSTTNTVSPIAVKVN